MLCMCIYIYIYTHTYTHIYIHTYMRKLPDCLAAAGRSHPRCAKDGIREPISEGGVSFASAACVLENVCVYVYIYIYIYIYD